MWQEFMDILRQMVAVYTELEELGKKKRACLVVLNLAELEAVLKEANKKAVTIANLEKQRQQLFIKLACTDKRLRPDIKMQEMTEILPKELQKDFVSLQEDLTSVVSRVKKEEDETSLLVRGALDAVNVQLNRIGGTKVEPTYGNHGQDLVSHRKNFEFNA